MNIVKAKSALVMCMYTYSYLNQVSVGRSSFTMLTDRMFSFQSVSELPNYLLGNLLTIITRFIGGNCYVLKGI